MATRFKACSISNCNGNAHSDAKGAAGMCRGHRRRFLRHGDAEAGRVSNGGLEGLACSVAGCGRKAVNSRGWCSSHYMRWLRHGDPIGGRGPQNGEPLAFLKRIVGHTGLNCLIWPYSRTPNGYGQLSAFGGHAMAHRLICEIAHGSSPSTDHEAAHSCGKGADGCVNPHHIRWATKIENAADKVEHGTMARGERQGSHKLTEQEVIEIRDLYRCGEVSQIELARRFGVSASNINMVINRKTWAWLEHASTE